MGKNVKRLMAMAMAVTVIGSAMTACSSGDSKSEMGRYVEEYYEAPENVEIYKVVKLEDGKIGGVGYDYESGYTSFISEDGGQSWVSQPLNLPEIEGKQIYASEIGFISEDKRLVGYSVEDPMPDFGEEGIPEDYEWVEPDYYFAFVDAEGNSENVEIDFSEYQDSTEYWGIPTFKVNKSGDIFFQLGENRDKIVQFDGETLEEKNIYEVEEYLNDFFFVGDSLVAPGWQEVVEFDVETGEEKGRITALEEIAQKETNYYITYLDSGSDDKIYYYSTLGLFAYDMKTEKATQLIDGAISVFGDNDMYIRGFLEKDNGEFLGIFSEMTGTTSNINFAYNPDIPSKPENQLVVYSLVENYIIRQAVSKYAKSHPDTYVKYDIGLSYDSGMTKSDALKTLNTEIMAGNGPDILVLDELSADSYIEKGLLEDISDIINPLVESGDVFKNIAEAYTVDGKIYQMPLYFKYPILVGKNEDVNSITDLNSLVEVAKKYSDLKEKRIFSNYFDSSSIVYSLYSLYGQDWLNDDNTINEEALTTFLEKAKELMEIVKVNDESYYEYLDNIYNDLNLDGDMGVSTEVYEGEFDDEDEYVDEWEDYYNENKELIDLENLSYYLLQSIYPESIIQGSNMLGYGGIDGTDGYSGLITSILKGEDLGYKVLSSGEDNIFIPQRILGVNAKGKNKDQAKELISFLLEEKENENMWGTGLSVNKNTLMNQLKYQENEWAEPQIDEETGRYINYTMFMGNPDGTELEINMLWPNEEDINKLISEIESLNVAVKVNPVLLAEVSTQFAGVANGELSIEEAVNKVVDNLDLYLSE